MKCTKVLLDKDQEKGFSSFDRSQEITALAGMMKEFWTIYEKYVKNIKPCGLDKFYGSQTKPYCEAS